MVMHLAPGTRVRMNRQGYSNVVATDGWETHELPLFTHRELSDKKPGDIAFKAHIGTPGKLDSAEAQYIALKGTHGFFSWPPSECMEHEFTHIELVPRKGGGVIEQRGEKTMGCKWCRTNQPNGLQGAVEEQIGQMDPFTAEPTVETVSTPPAITVTATEETISTPLEVTSSVEGVRCSLCPAVMKTANRNGRAQSLKQQLYSLKLHTKTHST